MKDRNQKWEMTCVYTSSCVDSQYKGGEPAKYITSVDPPNKQMKVCGIHKNSVDKMFIRRNSKKRCEAIK